MLNVKKLKTSSLNDENSSYNKLRILVTGDFCPTGGIERLCLEQRFDQVYGNVLPILKNKDLSITNLECPLTDTLAPINKTGPNLVADPKCAQAIKYGGFDIVSLANNHILDQGEKGLQDTLQACEKYGLRTVGAGENLTSALQPLFITVKNKKIAVLNFAEHEFSIAAINKAGAAPLNPVRNYYQILEAKRTADIVIVIIHGGSELYPLPSPRMVETYRFFADLGATAVIGHHTHCSSGFEIFNGVPIFYSLGNFLFDWKNMNYTPWYEGYFIKLTVTGNKVTDIALTPYFQCKGSPGLELMDADNSARFLGEIEEYSSIIHDSDMLEAKWHSFCKSRRLYYLSTVLSLNLFQRQLLKKNLLTRFYLKKAKLINILNIFRCQAHRNVATDVIKQELGDEIQE